MSINSQLLYYDNVVFSYFLCIDPISCVLITFSIVYIYVLHIQQYRCVHVCHNGAILCYQRVWQAGRTLIASQEEEQQGVFQLQLHLSKVVRQTRTSGDVGTLRHVIIQLCETELPSPNRIILVNNMSCQLLLGTTWLQPDQPLL